MLSSYTLEHRLFHKDHIQILGGRIANYPKFVTGLGLYIEDQHHRPPYLCLVVFIDAVFYCGLFSQVQAALPVQASGCGGAWSLLSVQFFVAGAGAS